MVNINHTGKVNIVKRRPVKFESKLMKWSQSRLAAYQSSGRERLSKGSRMPFSPAKLKAAYMSLFSQRVFSLSDIARECGVKYGVLKVWRTEERFKKQTMKNMGDYTEFFVSRYLENLLGSSKDMDALNADFYTYSRPLKMRIVSMLLSGHVSENDLEGTELKLSVISGVNILLQQTIECLMAERPMKISTLEEIIYLQNFQLFLMNNIRREFYENVVDKMILRKIGKHISGQSELKRVLKAVRFVDSELEKILNWRMGPNG